MIFSPEGVVSSQDYKYQIKAVCKMVSNLFRQSPVIVAHPETFKFEWSTPGD